MAEGMQGGSVVQGRQHGAREAALCIAFFIFLFDIRFDALVVHFVSFKFACT